MKYYKRNDSSLLEDVLHYLKLNCQITAEFAKFANLIKDIIGCLFCTNILYLREELTNDELKSYKLTVKNELSHLECDCNLPACTYLLS